MRRLGPTTNEVTQNALLVYPKELSRRAAVDLVLSQRKGETLVVTSEPVQGVESIAYDDDNLLATVEGLRGSDDDYAGDLLLVDSALELSVSPLAKHTYFRPSTCVTGIGPRVIVLASWEDILESRQLKGFYLHVLATTLRSVQLQWNSVETGFKVPIEWPYIGPETGYEGVDVFHASSIVIDSDATSPDQVDVAIYWLTQAMHLENDPPGQLNIYVRDPELLDLLTRMTDTYHRVQTQGVKITSTVI